MPKDSQDSNYSMPKLVNIRTLSGSWTGARTYGAPAAGVVWYGGWVDPDVCQLGELWQFSQTIIVIIIVIWIL